MALVFWMQEKSFMDFSAQRIVNVNNSLVLENDRTLKGAVFNVLDMSKYLEEIQETLKHPQKLIVPALDKGYYFRYCKYLKAPNRYILVLVKYLNNEEGFIISTYQTETIRW